MDFAHFLKTGRDLWKFPGRDLRPGFYFPGQDYNYSGPNYGPFPPNNIMKIFKYERKLSLPALMR